MSSKVPTQHNLMDEPGSLLSTWYIERALPAVFTTRDLTVLFVVILFFITNISGAVAGGAASLSLWVLGAILFLIPCCIATAQLGAMFPHTGSLYIWTHKAFGGFMSFFVGFSAWVPSSLLILATADLVIRMLQGLNPKWLVEPWSQGVALLVILVFSCIVALQRQRMVQNLVNLIFVLVLLAVALVFLAGLAWLIGKHPSAASFSQPSDWNPFSSTNIPLFGVITLGYLGVNLPLNQGGELVASTSAAQRRMISRHLLWGAFIVLACYLLSTFGVLVVQGQKASFTLFAPVSTVYQALGPIAGGAAAVCILATLLVATVVYQSVFARFLLVGGIDQRLPIGLGKLNRNRIPANAILFQTILACLLVVVFFMVVPNVGVLRSLPLNLSAASFYFVFVGVARVLWAFSTTFLFVDLLWLMLRQRETFLRRQIFPTWVLALSCGIGLIVSLLAILSTMLYSYDPLDIPNGTWRIVGAGLTMLLLVIGALGGMIASSEASWQGTEDNLP